MHSRTDPAKGPVVTQRKIIVRNPDGTTKVIVQNVVSAANKPAADGQSAPTPNQPIRQKLGITRGPDGKITSVTGLQPGQQLIESPQGLRIVTSTPNRNAERRQVLVKGEPPKPIAKAANDAQDTDSTPAKAPIVVRQVPRGAPANVIVKSVTNKSLTPATTQRVILNNAQGLGTPSQQIVTSKRQIAANSVQQKIIRAANIRQVVGQSTTTTTTPQKFVINSNSGGGNKILLATSSNSQVSNQNSTVTTQQTLIQKTTNQQQQVSGSKFAGARRQAL